MPRKELSRKNDPGVGRSPSLFEGLVSIQYQRSAQERSLTPIAHGWLAKLAPRYQPFMTARRHPHIVNRLSSMWQFPSRVQAYFDELLLASRSSREGFSLGVLTELTDLQGWLEKSHAPGASLTPEPGLPGYGQKQVLWSKPLKTEFSCEPNGDQRR